MEPQEKTRRIIDYIRENTDAFTREEIEMIISYMGEETNNFFIPDIIRELYDELGLLPSNRNIYAAFMNLVDGQFDIKDKKIIEVGGGVIPRLSKRISEFQTTGKITVYDPRVYLFNNKRDNLVLKRRYFTYKTDIEDTDLLIGLMPCEAANVIVDVALKNKRDFMIALCEGGNHGDEYDFYVDEDEWRSSLMYLAEDGVKKQNMGKLKVKYLKEYGDPYPIIFNDRG